MDDPRQAQARAKACAVAGEAPVTMGCCEYTGLVRFVYDWQIFIAGIGAVFGGWLAYRAGVKQAKETRAAADRQIRALEQQNADLRRLEQERVARESLIAARMLAASMQVVADDIRTARSIFSGPTDGYIDEPTANLVRQRVGKPGFAYLWEKVGLLDREIAEPFLQLEASIDQVRSESGTSTVGSLTARLNSLSLIVQRMHGLAGAEIDRTRTVLTADETLLNR